MYILKYSIIAKTVNTLIRTQLMPNNNVFYTAERTKCGQIIIISSLNKTCLISPSQLENNFLKVS